MSCGPSTPAGPPPDPAKAPAYLQSLDELARLVSEAEAAYQQGKADEASAKLEKAKPLLAKALAISRPPLKAMESAGAFDDLYGRMLLSNRHYGWARMIFQKNVARWKNWTPQTDETRSKMAEAEARLAEADRALDK